MNRKKGAYSMVGILTGETSGALGKKIPTFCLWNSKWMKIVTFNAYARFCHFFTSAIRRQLLTAIERERER